MGTVFITADILPTPSNEKLFENGDVDKLLGKALKEEMLNADFRICDLEGPLTNSSKCIKKSGPALKGSTASIEAFRKMKVNCFLLANNHIMDYGKDGFAETLNTLNHHGIEYCGAGANLSEAKKGYIFSIENKKIGVLNFAEHEFSIARDNKPGANPYDPLESFDNIADLKSRVDFLMVFFHGGKEHYRYVAPYLQRICRKMAEKGSDLIVCNHCHCIGCMEKYLNSTIVYGQGNFLLDRMDNEYRNSGLIILLDTDTLQVSYDVVIKNQECNRLATADERKLILSEFNHRSEQIQNPDFLREEYKKFALENVSDYEIQSLRILKRVLKKFGLTKYVVTDKARLFMLNSIRCEAHRDLMREGLIERIWPDEKHW